MKLLPYDRFEVKVGIPAHLVQRRLQDSSSEGSFLGGAGDGKDLVGEVEEYGFKLHRRISYRNSFLPVMEGAIQPLVCGTKITVTMRLHRLTQVFLAFWSIIWLLQLRRDPFQSSPFLLLPVVMAYCGFWFEAKKSKRKLLDVFDLDGGGDASFPGNFKP